MKAPVFCLACLAGISMSASAVESVTVSASSAVRIAWLETTRSGIDREQLSATFRPVFRRSLEGIYGQETPIEFVPLSAAQAAKAMANGEVDAAIVFGPRLPRGLARAGAHVLSAASIENEHEVVARLILAHTQPRLDDLLANAFSAAINSFDVRRSLGDKVPEDVELAAW